MADNGSTIRQAIRDAKKEIPKKDPFKGAIVDPAGQWKYPGEVTKIPSNKITMEGVPYPVKGVDDQGNEQMMYPGQNYTFPGSSVTEYPQLREGGWLDQMHIGGMPYTPYLLKKKAKKKGTKKNIQSSINQMFTRNHEVFGASGRLLYNPHSKYQEGGAWLDTMQEGGPPQAAPQSEGNITLHDGLRTWDLGELEGSPETDDVKDLVKYYITNPHRTPPGGEPYGNFMNRVFNYVGELDDQLAQNPDRKPLNVTHSQVLKLLEAWEDQGRPDLNEMDLNPIAEGQEAEPAAIKKLPLPNGTGIFMRHGKTDQNKGQNKKSLVRTKDAELVPEGVEEAADHGPIIKKMGITDITASPLPRTVTTAQVIERSLNGKEAQLGGSWLDNLE